MTTANAPLDGEENPSVFTLPFEVGSKEYLDSISSGGMGNTIILGLGIFNTFYYGDLIYRRIILSRYHKWGLGMRTWWGVQGTLRMLINFGGWAFMGVLAALC